MSIQTKPEIHISAPLLVVSPESLWRLRVEQYHAMIRAGILTDDDPVELLEGWLVTQMPKNPPHRLATQLTREALEQAVPKGWFVDAQEPITTDDSEPEPDVAVVRGARRDYAGRHPSPQEVMLVVKVADTTLQRDRTLKKRLYARAAIPTYWILNLPDSQLEVYTNPSGPAENPDYHQRTDYLAAHTVALTLDGQEVVRLRVKDLLP